jgi:hypothetical protein
MGMRRIVVALMAHKLNVLGHVQPMLFPFRPVDHTMVLLRPRPIVAIFALMVRTTDKGNPFPVDHFNILSMTDKASPDLTSAVVK